MPSGFNRFRYLNESGTEVDEVAYSAFGDPYAEPESRIYTQNQGNGVPQGEFSAEAPPGGEVPGVRALKIDLLRMDTNPNPTDLTDWRLTSDYDDAELSEVEIIVSDVDGVFLATARIYFTDLTYEVRQRFFG